MKRMLGIGAVILIAVLVLIFIRREPAEVTTNTQAPGLSHEASLFGVSLSPRSFAQEDFLEFWGKFPEAGNAVTWVGSVFDLAGDAGAPRVVQALAEQRDLSPIIVVHLPTADVRSPERRQEALELLAAFATESKPRWLGIGNEVNYAYRDDAAAMEAFREWFPSAVSTVHDASPNTSVFTVLQFEWLRGLHGGLFGGENDEVMGSAWTLLDDFASADAFAFTTYPSIIYGSPQEIPNGYYEELASRLEKPFGFTETGWFRAGPTGWESSADEQVQFIERWLVLTDPLDTPFRIWTFLYDQPSAPSPFETGGLLAEGEDASAPWEAWITSVQSRVRIE